MTPLLNTQVLHKTKMTKVLYASDKPIRILGSIKLHVHIDQMTKLLNFLVFERLAVQAILGCNFCDQFEECIYPKTRKEDLIEASKVSIVRLYSKQR